MAGIFDSHAHYDDSRFRKDCREVLTELPQKGVEAVLNCGANLRSSERSLRLADEYGFVYAAVGIHPSDAGEYDPAALDRLKEMAKHPKAVAVGEIGLDYHYENIDIQQQKRAFCEQLELAEQLGLPVVIHSRDALPDTLDCIAGYSGKGVFHCFSESRETAGILMKKDFYFGFGGVLTFPNARKAAEAAAAVPLDRLLIETDCPYMAPVPCRGERNDSSLLVYVAERLAQIRGVGRQEIIEITSRNARRLFNID